MIDFWPQSITPLQDKIPEPQWFPDRRDWVSKFIVPHFCLWCTSEEQLNEKATHQYLKSYLTFQAESVLAENFR